MSQYIIHSVNAKPRNPVYQHDVDIIDCRHSYIEHKASTAAIYSRRYGPNNEGIITLQRDRGGIHDFVVTLKNNGSTGQFYVRDTSHKPDIERSLNLLANTPKVSKCIEKDEVSNMAGTILVLRQEAMDFGKNQHEGYYSPNLQHSEPDYLSVKMSDIDDNYLEHAANPYPYRPDVKLDGNQLVITFTDVTNNRTAILSVNLVGAKNYKDVEDRLDNLLKAAYDDGKDWGNISKNAFDSIMRQARSLNIFNEKTGSNSYRKSKSKSS